MKISKITKVAGAGLFGFVAVSLASDKANLAPLVSQIAGFAGAFVGSLVAKRRTKKNPAELQLSRRPLAHLQAWYSSI